MKPSTLCKALCAGALSLLAWSHAQADAIKVTMTVDNSYALFVGNLTGATSLVGSDLYWPTVETYNFNLNSDAYLYVVTASDRNVAQGFLGQFENTTRNYKFYSQDPQWQVMATGLGAAAPYTDSAADLTLLSNEILDANAGGNLSQGWTNFTAGEANGAQPWGTLPGIDSAAQWVWYGGGTCNRANPTLGGCDAGEWLVFRIAVAATPVNPVPEPASLALVALGLSAAAIVRRRRR